MRVGSPLLVVISGPTGVGKTDLAISLAQRYDTEIISADSRQVYKQLNIGVGRPSEEQLKVVPHHFIASHDVEEPFSAGQYEREALTVLDDLFKRHDIVFVVGGTGLYIRALTEGLDEFPDSSRDKWTSIYQAQGITSLREALKKDDKEYYDQVDLDNPHRLIRALSVIDATGQPFSTYRKGQKKARSFRTLRFALVRPREELYERINSRVDGMMASGLLEEVKELYQMKSLPALQTVGYQELFEHLDGHCTLDEAVEKIKQHSRNYAKRQMTWFRNQGDWTLIPADKSSESIIKAIDRS